MCAISDLTQACSDGNTDQVREILESHKDLTPDVLEESLGKATWYNHPEIEKQLLDHGAEITQFVVHGATHSLSVPSLRHLLDHGWDVNSKGTSSPALRSIHVL